MVSVTEEVSIGQRRGGSRHGQGKLSVTSIQGQGNAKPYNYRVAINF